MDYSIIVINEAMDQFWLFHSLFVL